MNIKIGDKFKAIVRKSEHSRTLGGQEGAGKKFGEFICTNNIQNEIWADEFVFKRPLWILVKI